MTGMFADGAPVACRGCKAVLDDLVAFCPRCSRPVDASTVLEISTRFIDSGARRVSVLEKLRNALGRGLPVTPAARAHFGRSGESGKVASLLVMQASGDASDFPAAILETSYQRSSQALKMEIIRTLAMGGTAESVTVLTRIREEEKDPVVLAAFGERVSTVELNVDDITFPSLEVEPRHQALDAPSTHAAAPAADPVPRSGRFPRRPHEATVPMFTNEVGLQPVSIPPTPASPVSHPPESLLGEDHPAPAIPDLDNELREMLAAVPSPVEAPAARAENSVRVATPIPATLAQPPARQVEAVGDAAPRDSVTGRREAGRSRSFLFFSIGALLGFVSGGLATAAVLVFLGVPGGGTEGLGALAGGEPVASQTPNDPASPKAPAQAAHAPARPASPAETDAGPDEAASAPEAEKQPEPAPEPVKVDCTISASSSHKKFPTKNLSDGDRATVWQENKKAKALGQTLAFQLPTPGVIDRIGIVTGFDATEKPRGDLWPLNNRLKTATVTFPGGMELTWELQDSREMQWLEIDNAASVDGFTLTIVDVYEGSWFRDNAIGEIEVWIIP